MRKSLALFVLALACLAPSVGCRGGVGDRAANAGAEADPAAVIVEVNMFTDELLKKVETGPDLSAGVDEAQKLLDSRKEGLRAHIESARRSRKNQEHPDARAGLLDCENTNIERVSGLRKNNLNQWLRDTAFKTKLDKFEGDYRDLFK